MVAIIISRNIQINALLSDQGVPWKEFVGPLFNVMAEIESGLKAPVLKGKDISGADRMA